MAKELICYFDFKSIAAHEDFRSFKALHLLFRIYHESVRANEDKEYLTRLFSVLRDVVGVIEENKIILRDLFDDDHAFLAFYSHKSTEYVSLSDCIRTTDGRFSRWYFGPRGKHVRDKVTERLSKELSSMDKRFVQQYSKLKAEHQQRQQKSRARSSQSQKWNTFALVEQRRKHVDVASTSDMEKLLALSSQDRADAMKQGHIVFKRTQRAAGLRAKQRLVFQRDGE